MSDEITYLIEFVLRPGSDSSARMDFLAAAISHDVHLERVEVGEDGRGVVVYTDPPVTPEERATLMRWLHGHALVHTYAERVAPVAGLVYEFTSEAAPVQAEGTLAGHEMYFRARWDEWSFAVSEHADVDPSAIDSPEAADARGWFRGGSFQEPYAGSRLPTADADSIIRICAREYLYDHTPSN